MYIQASLAFIFFLTKRRQANRTSKWCKGAKTPCHHRLIIPVTIVEYIRFKAWFTMAPKQKTPASFALSAPRVTTRRGAAAASSTTISSSSNNLLTLFCYVPGETYPLIKATFDKTKNFFQAQNTYHPRGALPIYRCSLPSASLQGGNSDKRRKRTSWIPARRSR